jgi:polysaccharide export outer membrane protein
MTRQLRVRFDWIRLQCVMVMALAALAAGGCASPSGVVPVGDMVPELNMVLAAGDELEIAFLGAPQLNSVQKIRRDGLISLQIFGELRAAGKTPSDLRKALRALTEQELQIKDVSVTLRTHSPVFVMGAVMTPGRFDLSYPLTALQAIAQAGGFDPRQAEVRSVVVVRHQGAERFCFRLDFGDTLKGKKEGDSEPFYLKPLDIVYVPRTFIVKVNQWVDQHFYQLLPNLGWTYDSEGNFRLYW